MVFDIKIVDNNWYKFSFDDYHLSIHNGRNNNIKIDETSFNPDIGGRRKAEIKIATRKQSKRIEENEKRKEEKKGRGRKRKERRKGKLGKNQNEIPYRLLVNFPMFRIDIQPNSHRRT